MVKLPVAALAKRLDEVFLPGMSEAQNIARTSSGLRLLQQVRDEAHRFANTYNAQLRLKKISESILDEFPGLGEKRKAALLKKFKSVQRLRTATEEEIAAVPGLGGKTAAKLREFLVARG